MIQLRPRSSEVRCPLCLSVLDDGDVRTCARCRTGSHDACARELTAGECPTAGCATPLARRRVVVVPRPAPRPSREWLYAVAIVCGMVGVLLTAAVTNFKNALDHGGSSTLKINDDITRKINGG